MECPLSPWPRLNDMFKIQGMKENGNLEFQCTLCLPKKHVLSAAKTTNSNLRKHIKAKHPRELGTFERLLQTRSLDELSTDERLEEEPSKKQRTLEFCNERARNQGVVDKLIIDFVVGSLQPFSIVENAAFQNMISELAPGRRVLTRKALMSGIDTRYAETLSRLKETLAGLKYVCVTADCWTTFHRCYLGVMALWLEPDSLRRQTSVLACRRLDGRATYDKLAECLSDILQQFDIQGKVTRIVTDNGSNFLKAFRVFGEDNQTEEDAGGPTTPLNVGDILQNPEGNTVCLPPHHRCAAHCLNLVATVDASRAEQQDDVFQKSFKAVMFKCKALWAKQGQSSVAADTIVKFCGIYLRTPVATRWNSLYDALECILKLHKNGKDLTALCRTLQTPCFQNPGDFKFIEEYCEVMKPVACALDVLQKDKETYIGYLLPTISVLQRRLEYAAQKGTRTCAPLIQALLDGLHKRFAHLESNKDFVLASCVIPKFKLDWIANEEKRRSARMLVEEEVSLPAYAHLKSTGAEAEPRNDAIEDFFSFGLRSRSTQEDDEVCRFFATRATADDSLALLKDFPRIQEIFLRYNTATPSSASVERLFSCAADVLTRKRGRMTDSNFEKQLVLKCNQ